MRRFPGWTRDRWTGRLRHLCLVIVLLVVTTGAALGQPVLPPDSGFTSRIDSLVVAEMEGASIPGATVAVVEGEDVIHLNGYGVSDVDTQRRVDPDSTVFHVASLSKPVTATAVLQQVERGALALDRPVNTYLKSFSVDSPFDREVTVEHLLTHTGGFDRRILGRKAHHPQDLGDLETFLAETMPPVIRRPGTISVYSNYGFALAGYLVDLTSGRPFPAYVDSNVFEPLGMDHSSFAIEPDLESRLATGYGWTGARGAPVARDYIRTVPASMLRTTAADMTRWMRAIVDGGILEGQRVLDFSSTRRMLSRQFSNNPHLPGRSYGLGEGSRYASPEFLHAGGASGFSAAVVLLPAVRAGIFVAFNSQASPWSVVRGILDRYDAVLDAPQPPPFIASDVDTDHFAGYYRNAEIPVRSMASLGALVEQVRVSAPGPGQVEWAGQIYEAVSPRAFRERDGDQVVAFAEDAGRVTYFSRQGGEYERVSWFAARPVQLGLWAGFALIFLGIVLFGGGRALTRRWRTGSKRTDGPGWPIFCASAASVIYLLFIGGLATALVIQMDSGGLLEYGPTGWILALLTLPFVGGALSASCLVVVGFSWGRHWWSGALRTAYTLWALTLVAFLPFLAFWHLLGFPNA